MSIFDGQGYFFNDDRASGGKLEEDDILNCGHCQKSMKKSEWKKAGGRCFVCDGFLCISCFHQTRQFGCQVFERQIEKAINDQYRIEQNRKLFG